MGAGAVWDSFLSGASGSWKLGQDKSECAGWRLHSITLHLIHRVRSSPAIEFVKMSLKPLAESFEISLGPGTTAVSLRDSLAIDVDLEEITLVRDRSDTMGFSLNVATNDHKSLDGIQFQHTVSITDGGQIPELTNRHHVSDERARHLQSITFALGCVRRDPQSEEPIDNNSIVTVTRDSQSYNKTLEEGKISAVPVSAEFIHRGEVKTMTELQGSAWAKRDLRVKRAISCKGTDMADWEWRQKSARIQEDREADAMVAKLVKRDSDLPTMGGQQ